jgi:DnaJ-like protein
MSFEKLVEQIISEAMAKGEFDDLAGRGHSIDLNSYFALPEHLRAGYAVLKNAGVIPMEVELLKEVQDLRVALSQCTDEEENRGIRKKIEEKLMKYTLMRERYK